MVGPKIRGNASVPPFICGASAALGFMALLALVLVIAVDLISLIKQS